ncbi:MAG: molybdenum ABC transporter ATP-binding protein [Candidatus Xenobia bacterium]
MVLNVVVKKRQVDVAFEVPPGVTILFGPSGSGKTTILDCIAGLQPLEAGRVTLNDEVLSDRDVSTRRIGYVFQTLALFPHLTVAQNVGYACSQQKAQEMLRDFRLEHLATRHPHALSGGERQRVALARTLAPEPRVLLLDEPLSALDEATRSRIVEDLAAWNARRRIPVLYVTHHRREAFALGERLLVLEAGHVMASGTPHAVLNAPSHETLAELAGFENVLPAQVLAEHEADGTMTCQVGNVTLEVPLIHMGAGALKVAVRAGDIMVATQPPAGLSAQNVLPGQVLRRERVDATEVLAVRCGDVDFTVHLTPAAAARLELAPDRAVWLVLKTWSCHLVQSR